MPEIRARIDETGPMGDGPLVGVDGFVVAAEPLQRDAKIVAAFANEGSMASAPLACHGECRRRARPRQPAIAPARGVVRRTRARGRGIRPRLDVPALMQQHTEGRSARRVRGCLR